MQRKAGSLFSTPKTAPWVTIDKEQGVNPAVIAANKAALQAKIDYAAQAGHGSGKHTLVQQVKSVGRQIERSLAVAAPILIGPGLGQKVSVGILHGGSQYAPAKKTALKMAYRTGQYSGAVVQYGATIVASVLGGPLLGGVANKVTGFAKAGGAYLIRKEQYAQGFTQTKPKFDWRGQAIGASSLIGLAAGTVGGEIAGSIGAQIGGEIGTVGGALARNAIIGDAGSSGSPGTVGGSGAAPAGGNVLLIAAVIGLVIWSVAA